MRLNQILVLLGLSASLSIAMPLPRPQMQGFDFALNYAAKALTLGPHINIGAEGQIIEAGINNGGPRDGLGKDPGDADPVPN